MGVVHVGLVHCDPCECKVKGFRAVSSIERNVSNRRHLQGVRQMDAPEWNYQIIANACGEVRAREREREALIQAPCKRLGNVQPDALLEAVDDLPS